MSTLTSYFYFIFSQILCVHVAKPEAGNWRSREGIELGGGPATTSVVPMSSDYAQQCVLLTKCTVVFLRVLLILARAV